MSEKEKMHEDNMPEHNQAREDEETVTPKVSTGQPTEASDTTQDRAPADSDPIASAGDTLVEEHHEKDASALDQQNHEPRNAQQEMDDAVAQESEDESTKGRHK